MVSSRRISRACCEAGPSRLRPHTKYQGRGAQVASAQAGAPQVTIRAGFGEGALADVSKGKVCLIFL